jgi:hypothetical protein
MRRFSHDSSTTPCPTDWSRIQNQNSCGARIATAERRWMAVLSAWWILGLRLGRWRRRRHRSRRAVGESEESPGPTLCPRSSSAIARCSGTSRICSPCCVFCLSFNFRSGASAVLGGRRSTPEVYSLHQSSARYPQVHCPLRQPLAGLGRRRRPGSESHGMFLVLVCSFALPMSAECGLD